MEKNKWQEAGNANAQKKPSRKPLEQRTKMPIEQRAKQFMPFAAVTGLDKALAEVERQERQKIESKSL